MKEKIFLTGLLLGTNRGCITNQSVRHCNGNISVDLQPTLAGKVTLTVFCDLQGVHLAHFQTRDENVNSALYCEALLKLRDAIRRKRPDQLARGLLLHHDNARPDTARATQERIQELQWELLEHRPYTPDLAPSDFNLFRPPQKMVANVSLMTKRLKQRWGNG
jgi:histone-lysine N-methyltransferase SETMAR